MDPNDKTAPETTPEQDALTAMDAALAGEPMPEAAPAAEAEKPADPPTADAKPEGETVPDDGATPAHDNKKPEDTKSEDEKATPEPNAETEQEITGLGLKQKAAERFRELSAEVRELAPLRAELEQLGVKDVAGLQQIAARAKDGADLIGMVQETGATPEQYGQALDYIKVLNSGNVDQAITLLTGELQALCRAAGRAIPGIFNPLDGHQDLIDEVESGALSQQRAEELAGERHRRATMAEGQRLNESRERETRTAEEQKAQAVQAAKDAVTALGRDWEKADPDYAAKYPALAAAFRDISAKYPVHEWALRVELAYGKIPAPQKKPVPATGSPVRSGPPITPAMAPETDDPMEAMNFGIAQVTR